MRVLKWPVPVDDRVHEIGGGQVVHVDTTQGLPDVVYVWTIESSSFEDMVPGRLVQVFGTGHHVPDGSTWLGTTVHGEGSEKGVLVWHVFQR